MSISIRDATVSQLRLLTVSRRPLFLLTLFAGVWLFLDVVFTFNHVEVSWLTQMTGSALIGTLSTVVAVAWSMMVWRGEGPRARAYHWSLPVDTSAHDVARMLAGLVWLMVGVTWYIAFGIGVAATHGVAGATAAALTPLNVLSIYTASTIAYIAGTAIATTFEHPAEWVIGTAVFVLLYLANRHSLDSAFFRVIVGRYGIASVVYHGSSPYMLERMGIATDVSFASGTALWAAVAFGLLSFALMRNRGRRTT